MSVLHSITVTNPDTPKLQRRKHQRTLDQMKRDFKKFKQAGKKKIQKTAKLFNNVIRKTIVEVKLERVAPPYLHILLGILNKHYDLLENECHSLDEQIAKAVAKSDVIMDVHRERRSRQ